MYFISFTLAYGKRPILDPSDDQIDFETLPKGDLPLVIVHDTQKHSLKKVIELTIEEFVQKDSVIIVSRQKEELVELSENPQLRIVDGSVLSGVEAQWVIITVSDQDCLYEVLSRGRNGLVLIVDIPYKEW